VDVRAQGPAYSRERDTQQTLPEGVIVQKDKDANKKTGNKDEYSRDNAQNGFGSSPRRVPPFRDRLVIVIGRYGRSAQNACPNVMKI
jgi:hypothetical protein